MNNCRNQKGMIIHPGAIGDCLLSLPLASWLKQVLGISQVDWIGRTEYVDFYPGRTAIDRVCSMELIPFHRFFQPAENFEITDGDPLLRVFTGYEQIISFLGSDDPHFEQNLLYAIHCCQSAQVIMLSLDNKNWTGHISRYYLGRTIVENEISSGDWQPPARLIDPFPSDFSAGRELVENLGINPDTSIILIHPGSGGVQKCWAFENFRLLSEQIREDGHEIIFLLGQAEEDRFGLEILKIINNLPVLSGLSLTQVLQVLACSDGYIGNDSGISHLAAAMGKPTLAVFGPTNPAKFAPLGLKIRILQIDPSSFYQFSEQNVAEARKLLLEIL